MLCKNFIRFIKERQYHIIKKKGFVFNNYSDTKSFLTKKNIFSYNQLYNKEYKKIKEIKGIVGNDNFTDVLSQAVNRCNDFRNVKNTINEILVKEIQNKTPIIYRPYYYHELTVESELIPTLLIRTDYVFDIIPEESIEINSRHLNRKGYITVDYRPESLNIENGILKDDYENFVYECRMNVYNNILGNIQGWTPTLSIVMNDSNIAKIEYRYSHEEFFMDLIDFCKLSKSLTR
jgi:hypothetical protein